MSCAPTIADRLLRELDRSFFGPTWHGSTLLEPVSELSAAGQAVLVLKAMESGTPNVEAP